MNMSKPMEHREITERQAYYNAATILSRVARRSNRHPATARILTELANHCRRMALILNEPNLQPYMSITVTTRPRLAVAPRHDSGRNRTTT